MSSLDGVFRLGPAAHAEPVGEHGDGEQLHVVRQDEVAAFEQRPRLRGALQVHA